MDKKNKYGQYFTIKPIADFMVSLISHSCEARVLEPSCGEGVFLRSLLDKHFNNLAAYEIDNCLAKDYEWVKHESFVSSPLTDHYDVVIGNPPYIRWKNLESELKDELNTSSLWNSYFNSLCDYLFIFILKSIEQLQEGGELIFICTDYWMNTTHSKSLRNYMCQNGYFSDIYHFKEAPLFHGVTASFVIFRYVKSKEPIPQTIQLHRYNKRGAPSEEELNNRTCFDETTVPQFKKDRRWLLAEEDRQEELKHFEQSCTAKETNLFGETRVRRIGDICDIGNGMVSGLDVAFNVSELVGLTPREEASLINVLKAKNLQPYFYYSHAKYFFLPEDIEQEDFIENYPNFNHHLLPQKEKLDGRYSYGRKIPFWSFVFPRNKKLFERQDDKIFVPCKERISNKNYFRFCLAPKGYYPLQDVTAIVRKSNCRESIEFLLFYLNSKYVFDWLSVNGIVKGAIVEFSEAPIASIPYRAIDWNNPDEVAIHQTITNGVRECVNNKDITKLKNLEPLFNQLFTA